jgi:hypothetical protein
MAAFKSRDYAACLNFIAGVMPTVERYCAVEGLTRKTVRFSDGIFHQFTKIAAMCNMVPAGAGSVILIATWSAGSSCHPCGKRLIAGTNLELKSVESITVAIFFCLFAFAINHTENHNHSQLG